MCLFSFTAQYPMVSQELPIVHLEINNSTGRTFRMHIYGADLSKEKLDKHTVQEGINIIRCPLSQEFGGDRARILINNKARNQKLLVEIDILENLAFFLFASLSKEKPCNVLKTEKFDFKTPGINEYDLNLSLQDDNFSGSSPGLLICHSHSS